MTDEKIIKMEAEMQRFSEFVKRGEAMLDRCESAFCETDPKTGKDRLQRIVEMEDDYRFFRRASVIGHRAITYIALAIGAVIIAAWDNFLDLLALVRK